MTISVAVQTKTFLYSVALGVLIGVWYDALRALRRQTRMPRALQAVCDIVFWLVSAVVFLIFFYMTNAGQIRMFVFIGAAAGCGLYMCTVSRPLLASFCFAAGLLSRLLSAAAAAACLPFKTSLHIWRKLAVKLKKSRSTTQNREV